MKNYLSHLRFPFKKAESLTVEDFRQESLDLNFQRLLTRPKGLDINPGRIGTHLGNYTREKSQQIQEGVKFLEKINKVELKAPVRINLANTVLNSTAESITDLYRKYVSKGTSFPENAERKTDLTSAITLLQDLICCYKIILAHDYRLPLKKFKQQQSRVCFVSVKILELTMWLQRFLAIRFQKLPPQDWKDFNSIFFIYASIFDLNNTWEMTDNLSLYKASGIINDKNARRSVVSLYLSVQIFGLLDITSWPSKSITIIEQYLEKQEVFLDINIGKPRNEYQEFVITYANLDSPPVFEEKETSSSCCYINLSKLKKQIRRESDEIQKKKFIGEAEKKRLQPQGKVPDLGENHGLLKLLNRSLSRVVRTGERKTLYGSKSVQLYSGLAESYRLLYELNTKSLNKETETGLHDAAARHSSLLVDNTSDELECQWLIINESDNGILLRTVETKYMHAMEVGHIVTMRRDEEEDNLPQLGYITRLDRLSDGQVDVAIVRMSVVAEAVTILEPGQDQNTQDLLPGILIQNLDKEWQLILPRYVKYVTGTPAIIKRKMANIPVRLGDAIDSKNGFIMFEVRSPGLK